MIGWFPRSLFWLSLFHFFFGGSNFPLTFGFQDVPAKNGPTKKHVFHHINIIKPYLLQSPGLLKPRWASMGFRIDLGGTIDDAQTTLPWSSALFVATRDAAYAKACWITSISSISGGFLKLDPQVTIVGSIQNWWKMTWSSILGHLQMVRKYS